MKVEQIFVTPEIAARWLATSTGNRNVSDRHVIRLARDMTSGAWQPDEGTPIRFDVHGCLCDGQHRLMALIRSHRSFVFTVETGISEAAIQVMDTGRPRSVSDHLTMMGRTNTVVTAAALAIIYNYRQTGVLWRANGIANMPT